MQAPLVIGHRGASAHRPEHTAAAYRTAWRSGADSVEPDVVSTRDGVLVCRHDLDLALTTDVADRPEFASRRREVLIDGRLVRGWFVHGFDLEELRTLRARERWPERRPGSARYDDHFGVITLAELLDLREQESVRAGRTLGVHVELKHAAFFEALGLPLHRPLLELLRARGLTSALSPVSVMSFETEVLRRVRRAADVELVQLLDADRHGVRATRSRALRRVAAYADAVGLHRDLVATGAVERAKAAGLDVLVWTLGPEDAPGLLPALLDRGVDGVLSDAPDLAVAVRRSRRPALAS